VKCHGAPGMTPRPFEARSRAEVAGQSEAERDYKGSREGRNVVLGLGHGALG